MQIQSGWLTNVRHVPSPNHNLRPDVDDISLIVVHGISLPPGCFGGSHIDDLFCNQLDPQAHEYFVSIAHLQVSSHVLIRRDAEIVQYVAFDQRAWHAGASCYKQRANCNDFSIGIELEGEDTTAYNQVQYEQLIQLIRLLQLEYPKTRQNPVVGHCHIAPDRKTDPGPAFDWEKLRQAGIIVWPEGKEKA